MISLTYLSLARGPLDQEQLRNLLEVSRTRNLAAGVTGMLLYADEQFIQTLEGERHQVEATMSRIQKDPRHRDVDITLVEDLDERCFPDWSMGFQVLDADDVADLRGFTDFMEPDGQRYQHAQRLGRAGVFHRVFRDVIRPEQ